MAFSLIAHEEMMAEHERLARQLEEERRISTSLRAQLTEAEAARGRAEGEAAGLRAQLATEREARAAIEKALEQATAAKAPIVVQPAPPAEPPEYEVKVVRRDMNSRLESFRLKPVKAGS